MAVLVRPNGLLGTAYMAAIRPFRHLIVYPALMRQWQRAWQRRSGEPPPALPRSIYDSEAATDMRS
jgi:hypothetical protein